MPLSSTRYPTGLAGLLCAVLLLVGQPAQADRLEDQRRQYDQAQAALTRGEHARFEALKSQLRDYA